MNKRRQTMGPSEALSNDYVRERLAMNCSECRDCGEQWHFRREFVSGKSIQVNIAGRLMAVRRAAWIAFHPDRKLIDGKRITCKCPNPNCINPELLVQASPGAILQGVYKKGIRSKAAAAAHLLAMQLKRSKLSESAVESIRQDQRKGNAAAHEWGITPEHYNAIQRGASRNSRAVNPWAGLSR